ncbi:hypothetical protein [Microbacterium testaceum]|uniref:hypothetical protein n=1 Tax=Microbacterium testaceum TaxID=2033 RepID=UPI001246256D|nr:hypothetical protein [Microbacterium testaceum]
MPADTPLSRRTLLQASAWSVPAIVAATAVPAYAASGGQIAFAAVPEESTSCRATTEDLTAQLTGSSVAGELVQFTLSSGWTWARGSGSYVSDGAGVVTVPAGDIVAGVGDGSVQATWSSATASAVLPLTLTGPLTSTAADVAAGIPTADNTEMIRVATNQDGAVVVSASTAIWSRATSTAAWTSVGTGAAIGIDRAAYLRTTARQGAWWIRGGELMFGSAPDTLGGQSNDGFTRVFAMASIGVAVRSNGDVWKYDDANGFVFLGAGGATGPSQLAVLVSPTPSALWLKSGVIYADSAPASLPAGENSGFLRLYSSGGGAVAVGATGALWTWTEAAGWEAVDTGASTAAGQGTYLRDKAPDETDWYNDAPMWISNGELRYADGPASISDNEDFVRLAGTSNGEFVLAAKGNRMLWMWDYATTWEQLTTDAAPGAGQFAVDGSSKTPYWITPRSSC